MTRPPQNRPKKLGSHCLIIGGTGYIGRKFAQYAIDKGLFSKITIADIQQPARFTVSKNLAYEYCDVREPLTNQLKLQKTDWIINLAAVHREPGHKTSEYFETNVSGAQNVCDFASKRAIQNILFSSSIAVYGVTNGPADESTLCAPDTAYGASKLVAEQIHKGWLASSASRKLVVVRPGVVYGPGDPGNMLRLVHALQLGVFLYPGDENIRKSYAYIDGLLESFEFAMRQPDAAQLTFNYVERETLPLNELVASIKRVINSNNKTHRIPQIALVLLAHAAQVLSSGHSAVHPERVRKAAKPTHIVPSILMEKGFIFTYDFDSSLKNWIESSPQDFLASNASILRALQMRTAQAIFDRL